MNDLTVVATAFVHTTYALLLRSLRYLPVIGAEAPPAARDRGAVSLEQVLWFVAAGVGVAVIAAILWNKIRDEANTPVQSPSAP